MKKRTITNTTFYFLSLGIVFLLSFYPLMMGCKLLTAYFRDGYVTIADYPKYVIPYTPIAIAMILSVGLMPLIVKLCKKHGLLAVSLLGTFLFLLSEIGFERVVVFDPDGLPNSPDDLLGMDDVLTRQALMCYITPEALQALEQQSSAYKRTIADDLALRYSPIFKLHFYLIAILIVLAVLGVLYGFGKMIRENDYGKRKPLITQAVVVSVFIGLCILACFTAFYRTGTLVVSATSGFLMSIFFIVFGLTAGLYSGTLLYSRKQMLSMWIPALIACITTVLMYVGELILMGGVLFRFGSGFVFNPIGACPLAPIDFLVVILSGVITFVILTIIRQRDSLPKEPA